MPTPAEWCLAAFGPKGMSEPPEWVKNYIADRQQTWQTIQQAHYSYLQAHPELLIEYRRTAVRQHVASDTFFPRTGRRVVRTDNDYVEIPVQHSPDEPGMHSMVPWLFPTKDERSIQSDANTFSQQTIDNATKHIWDDWKEPINLLPVGSRDFDKSPYGAMDMVLNADELVMPAPTWPAGPSSVPDHYIHIGWQGIIRSSPEQPTPHFIFGNSALEMAECPSLPDVGLFMTSLRASRFLSNVNSPSDVALTSFPNLLALLSVVEAGEIGRPLLGWKMEMAQGPFHGGGGFVMNVFLLARPDEYFPMSPTPFYSVPDDMRFAWTLWARSPKHLRIEMGREPSLGPPRPTGNNLQDNYSNIRVSRLGSKVTLAGYDNQFVIAGGFRCAR